MADAVDVCVVGAGPWGLASAWRLAEAGARVALVDDGGRSAAEVAAGMLAPFSEAADGEEPLHRLMLRAAAMWEGFAAEVEAASGRTCGHRRGVIMAAARPEHLGPVRHHAERLARLGHPTDWLPGSRLRELEPGLGPSVAGGLDLRDEAQVDPRRLLAALRRSCASSGVERVEEAADALRRGGGGDVCGVTLRSGRRVAAGAVVLAAGWAAGRLSPRVPLRPVKGQILRLEVRTGARAPIERTVRTPAVYLVPRADGEVVVGATVEEAGDRDVTAWAVHELLEEAIRAVPDARELRVAECAAGLRPATPDGLPAIGRDPVDGLVWAVGGYRHGILLAPLAAAAVADAVAGRVADGEVAACAPVRFVRSARRVATAGGAPCA
jgi:glycine oxidase